MPLFEFYCEACNSTAELLVARNEKPACPGCGSKTLDKLMSVAAGRVSSGSRLPQMSDCPPPEAGPCHPNCCRLPM